MMSYKEFQKIKEMHKQLFDQQSKRRSSATGSQQNSQRLTQGYRRTQTEEMRYGEADQFARNYGF